MTDTDVRWLPLEGQHGALQRVVVSIAILVAISNTLVQWILTAGIGVGIRPIGLVIVAAAVVVGKPARWGSAAGLLVTGALLSGWNDADADRHIREGIPIGLATHLQSLLDLSNEEAAQLLLGRSRSTYSRYRNDGRLLQGAKAERTVRFARIIALSAETVGSIREAVKWMRERIYGLGGEKPIELAETEPGARMVRNVLHRVQHGIPS